MRSVVALVLLAARGALAADPPDLDKAIARCHELVTAERFADGERAVRAVFADFAGDSRVRARLTEIEEDLKICLFRSSTPAPTGKDLFGTACEQFNASTRAVSLDYYKPHGAYWPAPVGGLRVFTVPFEGDVTILFSTDWLNKDQTAVSAVLCWDAERGNGYACFPGYFHVVSILDSPPPGQSTSQGDVFTAARAIVRLKDGVETKLFEKPPEQQRFNFTGGVVTASRSGNRITLKIGDAVVATAADATFTSGCIGFRSDNPESIRIKGRIDATWLRTLVGQKLAARFAAWQKSSYDRAKEIPAWALSDAAGAADTTLSDLPSDAPASTPDEVRTLAPRAMSFDQTVAQDADAAAAGAPRATSMYLRALSHLVRGQFADAATLLGQLAGIDAAFVTGRLVRAFCAMRLRRIDEAKADLASVIAARPRCEYAYQLAVTLAIDEQDYDAADARLTEAAKNGVPESALAYWRKTVDRARRGPLFAQRFEASTAHHVVVSDHSKDLCARIAAELESMQIQYIAATGIAPPPGPKARAFVFADQASYRAFLADLRLHVGASSTGIYVPSMRALMLWALPDGAELTRMVRHEGFHAFLHRVLDHTPSWFGEGYACFMEHGGADGPAAGEVAPELRARFLPLRQLFALHEPEFLAKGEVCFPQSQCLVAFLRTTAHSKLRTLLRDYLGALRDGLSQEEAGAKVMEPVIDVLESEFSKR